MENIVKNELQFYAKLAKPLVLNLPKSKDRILAAAWIKKFMDENAGDERLRTTYLKLLLFCLQRRKLTGIFADDPVIYDVLEELPAEYDLNELAKNLLSQENIERQEKIKLEMKGDMAVYPAYTTDCSPDLTEYVAAQDIPNFGVHAYYAISKEPLNKWQKHEKAIFPKGTRSAIDTNITATPGPFDPCCCAPKLAASAPDVEDPEAGPSTCKKSKTDKEPERKKRKPVKMGQSPPTHPLGEVHHKTGEERVPPSWGSNLLEVKEPTDVGKIDEPSEAQIQLEEEASKILEDEEVDDVQDDDQEDITDSKAADMMHTIGEWTKGELDKSKKSKKPSKKGKGPSKVTKSSKGKKKYGPKPDNLPEGFADWTEKDLEEAGLTWADLMPVEENIDDELQRIEDEEMAMQDEDMPDDQGDDFFTDYDKLLREAEEDLERHKTLYDEGLEEDEPVVEHLGDEMEEHEEELDVSRTAEDVQRTLPALRSGIPITTPRRSPSPRRMQSPDTAFAQSDDVLLQPRKSPLSEPKKREEEPRKPCPREDTSGGKDGHIASVYGSAKKAIKQSSMQGDIDDFEAMERQFADEESNRGPSSPKGNVCPAESSPRSAQRVLERAQQQEALLRTPPRSPPRTPSRASPRTPPRTPPRAVDPGYLQFASEFADAEGGLDDEPFFACSPPPLDRSPQVYSPTTGAQLHIPEFPYGPDDVDSPDRFDYMNRPPPQTPEFIREARRRLHMDPAELKFLREFESREGDIGQEPCIAYASPPPMTEDEEFEFLEGLYSPGGGSPCQQVIHSPTSGAPLPIPEFNYGPEDLYDPGQFESTSAAPRPMTPRSTFPTQQEQQLQRAAAMTKAWEQEVHLRQGSPQAAEIIHEAEATLEGDLGRRSRVGRDNMLDESPPPGVKTPPRRVQLPPRPLFSPTTGEQLQVPDYDVAPEDLGVSWEDLEAVPEFESTLLSDRYLPTRSLRDTRDIFDRCGDPYTAAVDTAPIRPQYFPPSMDLDTDSPPPCSRVIKQHQIPKEFMDPKRPGMMKQSNIAVGAKRRQQFLDRQKCPSSQVSPIKDEPYLEHLHDILEPLEYKSPVQQAQGLSPWRDEEVYYTPSQGDSTMEDLDWPLASPLRTPPCQLPQERPDGYESPPIHEQSSPRIYEAEPAFIPGVSSPMTPVGQYPFDRQESYESPCSPGKLLSPIPYEAYWDPLELIDMGLSDDEGLDFDVLPVESPEPCTPRGDRRLPTPPTPTGYRVVQDSDRTPLPSRRLFTGEEDFDESPQPQAVTRPSPCSSRRQQVMSKIPSVGQRPSGSRIVPPKAGRPPMARSIGKIPSRIPSAGQSAPETTPSRVQRSIPAAHRRTPEQELYQGTPQAMTPIRRGTPSRIRRTPTRMVERTSRRLFTEGGPCGQEPQQPVPQVSSRRTRSPKHVTPPPRQPSPVTEPWLTPENMSGPSRRPTGLTPEGYNSDFENAPPARSPQPLKFAPARRIKKKGRRPPSPKTPTDPRQPPSPCAGSRAPFAAERRLPRRTFRDPGPSTEPPSWYSPIMEPFIPDEDTWVPPPPTTYKDPMYFPPEVMDTACPEEYPTLDEIQQHQVVQDREFLKHSRLKGPTAGPGSCTYRDSRRALDLKHARAGTIPGKDITIPEYPDDSAWRQDMYRRIRDVNWPDYINRPPREQVPPCRPIKVHDSYQKPRSPIATKDPERPRGPCGAQQRDDRIEIVDDAEVGACAGVVDDVEVGDYADVAEDEESFPSGYEDAFLEVLNANLQVPPELYPPPEAERRQRGIPIQPPQFKERFSDDAAIQRSEAFLAAAKQDTLKEHLEQRRFEDIAEQADMMFDTCGGLLDETPPEELGRNYYPDIAAAVAKLRQSVQRYDLPESPLPSPYLLSRTPPCRPQQWSPASVPSGSPRTPPPRPVARRGIPVPKSGRPVAPRGGPVAPRGRPVPQQGGPVAPEGGQCGTGPCGAGAVMKKASKGKMQLRETKSSQLRKQQQAKVVEEQLSPTSKMMKKRREKAEKAAEQKKKKAAAKLNAEIERKRAESMARVAEELPGGQMRPLAYTRARGTGEAPCASAKKEVPIETEYHDVAGARKRLFGGPCGASSNRGSEGQEGRPGGQAGRKAKGRKGPTAPDAVFRRRDSDDDFALPIAQGGPEFQDELMQHQVTFPGRQPGVVVGGKFKRIQRNSERAVDRMEEIGEEERSPCDPCGGDDYEAALREIGMTAEQAAAMFDPGFIDELEEEEEEDPAGSPNAIRQLEDQLREMDEYDRQQTDLWKQMAADFTDDELRELGITRAELNQPGPCGTCGTDEPGAPRPAGRQQLTQQQEQMLAQLQAIEDRADEMADEPQRSPVSTDFDRIEQEVIQREREEREYFERMMRRTPEGSRSPSPRRRTPAASRSPSPRRRTPEASRGPSPRRRTPEASRSPSPRRRTPDLADEQREFEELERQLAMEEQNQGVCPGSRSPRPGLTLDEASMQKEIMARQRLLEQQLQTQGPPTTGRRFPASGITYSPPRPQQRFGPPPRPTQGSGRPCSGTGQAVLETPPRRSPSPRIPTPPSPPPSPCGILEQTPPHFEDLPPSPCGILDETPPYFEDMEEDDRLPAIPHRVPGSPRRSPGSPRRSPGSPCQPGPPQTSYTRSPARTPPRPPPFPPSPPLVAAELRQHVAAMARPEFDVVQRRELLPRDDRRAIKAPSVGLCNVRELHEDEPIIPELGDESYMGWPVVEGERAPKKRRARSKNKKRKRLFVDDSPGSRSPSPGRQCQQDNYIIDDAIPYDLPMPIFPRGPPIQMEPLHPIPLLPWEGVGFRQPGPCRPPPPQLEMPVHTEIYQGGGQVHPDLADLVGYEPPLNIPEDIEDLREEEMGEELYYSPERYPEIEERELDRQAALAYQPPPVLQNIWLSSPQELGAFTPPSVGKGPCGTYTPTATPPLGLLENSLLENIDDDFMAPGVNVPGPCVREFMETTPPLEKITSIQELKYHTQRAKGRGGIKPKPMYFGGYGETPQRPIPRWHGRGGARNVIREVEEPVSPPTPRTPPPQLPAPLSAYSPELDEFQRLEQQMMHEAESKRVSKKRQKQRAINDSQRQMMRNELLEQAERLEIERTPQRPQARALSPPRVKTPCQAPPTARSPRRAPTPPQRIPTPPQPPMRYSPERQPTGSPCVPPQIHQYLQEGLAVEFTPPRTPDLMQPHMYDDIFEGIESPPPLSPERPYIMPSTPPTPPSPPPPPVSPLQQWYAEQMELYGQNIPDTRHIRDLTPPVTPDLMDQGNYDIFEGIESPPPLSPERPYRMPCTPPTPPSPPPAPMSPQEEEQWQNMYEAEIERAQRARQANEVREPVPCRRNIEGTPQRHEFTPPVTPDLMEQGLYDIFEGIESPPPLSPERPYIMPCTPPTPPSPPTPPPPARWEIYLDQRRAREQGRQDLYQRNMQDIQQMFGPSPGPPSPGPDADFYANIYGHQIPAAFRQGNRPRTVVRDQLGRRDINLRIPRHTAAQGVATCAIAEERPPQAAVSRPRTAPTSAVRRPRQPQVQQAPSAQRIADARKHYQQMGRQKTLETQRGGGCQGDQARSPLQADQEAVPQRQAISAEEAQRRTRERLRARRMQGEARGSCRGPQAAPRAPQAAPPPPMPFTNFMPPQVQRQIPRPQPPAQAVEDFARGPRTCAANSANDRRSRTPREPQPSTSRTRRPPSSQRGREDRGGKGGGCGGCC